MNRKETNIFLAILFIILGVSGLLKEIFRINIWGALSFWNIAILAIGLYFEWYYFRTRTGPGILVPGAVLTVIGLFEIVKDLLGLGFVFFSAGEIGTAIGLFQLYWFGTRNKYLLIPVVILLVAGIEDLSLRVLWWLNHTVLWCVVLVVLGIYFLINRDEKGGL